MVMNVTPASNNFSIVASGTVMNIGDNIAAAQDQNRMTKKMLAQASVLRVMNFLIVLIIQ